jgi:hypothetical protein
VLPKKFHTEVLKTYHVDSILGAHMSFSKTYSKEINSFGHQCLKILNIGLSPVISAKRDTE